jgi:hypothetical protein
MIKLIYSANRDGITVQNESVRSKKLVGYIFLAHGADRKPVLNDLQVVALATVLSGLSEEEVRKQGVQIRGFNRKKPWVLRKTPDWRVSPEPSWGMH